MNGVYFKSILSDYGFDYMEDGNSLIVDCGGNDVDFVRLINLINSKIESWVYNLELKLNIKIDTAYEKIVIEY